MLWGHFGLSEGFQGTRDHWRSSMVAGVGRQDKVTP
jgi:hypothetical protein